MPERINENLSDENQETSARLNTEWVFTVALREVIGIALKGESQLTYLQTLSLAQELFPKLFDENSLLLRQEESDVAREYRQIASAESSLQQKAISPLEMLDDDIEKYKYGEHRTRHFRS